MDRLLESHKVHFIINYVFLIFALMYQVVTNLVSPFVPRRLLYKRKDITGQKVLITGAGSGLGRQLAVEFSKHATCLILVDINRQSLLQTEKLLDRRSTVFIYDCDVSDYKKVYEMANKVKKDAGDVDILINNAGVLCGHYLIDIPEDDILRTMGVNALAHFWTVKAFLPAMMKKNSGHVVSIASVAGKFAGPKLVDYCASKYAAVGFAASLNIELRERKLDGVKVTTICPSHIDTKLLEGAKLQLGKIMTAEYVAKEITLAVLEEQNLVYIPHYTKFLTIIFECLPLNMLVKMAEFSGCIKGMENFTGRRLTDVNKPVKTD